MAKKLSGRRAFANRALFAQSHGIPRLQTYRGMWYCTGNGQTGWEATPLKAWDMWAGAIIVAASRGVVNG